MGIFDSALLKEINSTFLKKRTTVIGTSSISVGGGTSILLSQGLGTQTTTGALLSPVQFIDFVGENGRPVFVGLVVDKADTQLRGIGGDANSTGQGFYELRLTKGTNGSTPTNDLTSATWQPGTQTGPFGRNMLPPSSLWTIDYEDGDLTGRRQYGFRINGGASGLTLRIEKVRIMAFSIF